MTTDTVAPQLVTRNLVLTEAKVKWLWEQCSRFRTLFSDLTKGDYDNFIALLLQPATIWFEVGHEDSAFPLGLVWLTGIDQIVDADCHMMFFDKHAEADDKVEACRGLIRWAFENLPIQRLTAPIPELYRGTRRIAERMGFTHEGTKRRALLMDGRWIDVRIYGITRPEVMQ